LQNDAKGMAQQVVWAAGKPGFDDELLASDADTVAFGGRLGKARELSGRAVASAERAEEIETAASYEANAALREALFDNAVESNVRVAAALTRSTGRDVQFAAALALASAAEARRAQTLADDLAKFSRRHNRPVQLPADAARANRFLVARRGEAEFPRSIETILQQALQLRDRHAQGQISEHGVAVARGRLEVRMDRTLERRYRSPQNRRLANHLLRERDALFTFFSCPGLEATNWRAEQAIRPMVVTRKVWGGNRASRGAHTQGILVSILQTCRQQLRCASSILQKLICAAQPKPLDLTVPTR
jgi:transposase